MIPCNTYSHENDKVDGKHTTKEGEQDRFNDRPLKNKKKGVHHYGNHHAQKYNTEWGLVAKLVQLSVPT